MKQKKLRLFGLLLAAAMLLGCLPVQALAAEDGWFYLAADWNGTLLIAPERVSYTADQTIFEALNASGHSFGPDAESVTKIDGKTGNFIRSDETGSHVLTRNAAQAGIRYLCFTDRLTAQPSDARKSLIAAMADYRLEEPDVQLAAKEAYEAACAGYVTADDNAALSLYTALHNAVEQYKQTLDGQKYNVTFSDRNSVWQSGDTLYAENQYGRVYQDENGSGMLSLPAGSYTFTMQAQSGGVTGSITVPEQTSVTAVFDRTDWLKADGFMLASASKTEFDSSKLPVEKKTARELNAVLDDSFTGTLYALWPYDTSVFPDASKLKLTAIYTPAGGTEPQQAEQALKSRTSGVDGVLAVGMQGNTVVYRASTQDAQGMTQYQDYTLTIRRAPTLKELRVTEENGSAAALEKFDESTKSYTWLVLGQQVTLTLIPTETEGYELYVDGENVTETGSCTVLLEETEKTVTVELKAGGKTTQYTLLLRRTDSCVVRIPVDSADMEMTVCDENGKTVSGTFYAAAKQYRFTLIPGRRYTYTATKDTYYHVTESFVAAEKTLPRVSVQTGTWLTELALGKDSLAASKGSIALDQTFDPTVHAYTAAVPDTPAAVYLCIDGDVQTASTKFLAQYRTITSTAQDDQLLEKTITSDQLGKPIFLRNLLLNQNGRGNTLTIRCQRSVGSVTYYQDYIVMLRRTLSLRSLSLTCAGQAQTLTYSGGTGYTSSIWDYIVTVPAAVQTLSVCADIYASDACYRDGGNTGYHVWLDGRELTPSVAADVPLNGTADPETVTLTLKNEFAGEAADSEYRIQVRKAQPVLFTPQLTPSDALLFVCDMLSGTRVWPDASGAYELFDGFTYRYLLTCPGYAGRSGTIDPAHSASGALVLKIDEDTVAVTDGAARAGMTLRAAQKNETIQSLPAEWADFRGTSYDASGTRGGSAGSNNAVVSIQTPIDADASTLYWSNALGSGTGSRSTGCPLLVDGVLIVYAGDTLYRIDPVSGEILTQAKMDHASSFSITPPTYAKGMVFVGLSDGTIQAFDAKTLQSLWIYHDPLEGQPNSPITICGDYLYTGFWRSEEFPANFVCLSITDEDPTRTDEEKTACWYWTNPGGYYWAGAYACEDYVLVGTDDGADESTSMTGSLLLLDAKTGRLLDKWDSLYGDVRSTICYDTATKAFYFTTKGGWFCGVQTEKTSDGWRLRASSKWTLKLENGSSTVQAMSTSTPVVYNGRAYIGVRGTAQFNEYSGHSLTVVDLASHKIAYRALTQGYPQTSGILTTAYEAQSGYVYVYFVDNYTPGKLRVLRDKPGQTRVEYVTKESGVDTPYVLFTPSGKDAQYAICSPIVDSYGVMYFKNDSAKLMAVGPSATLEITRKPNKTQYKAGEAFDPTGMQVDLVYANGMRRDVTKYVQWSEDPLTEDDAAIDIRFPYALYHDQDSEESGRLTNVKTQTPVASVQLTVEPGTAESGRIGTLTWAYDIESGTLTISGEFEDGQKLAVAYYDQNGHLAQVKLLTQVQTLALVENGARIRLFLLDKTNQPVCKAMTVKG